LAVDLLREKVPKLQKIVADTCYKNAFCEHVDTNYHLEIETAQKPESSKGFMPEKNR
jgi:hypothetical protein